MELATVIDAVPSSPTFGVKVAVRVRPVPVIEERLPPETVTSPEVPFQTKVLPGSSEKVKVTVEMSFALKVERPLEIETVGGRVS